ncbi:MAG: type II toxin-antitoxin system RelB/DinJ family antitoxin [Eubacteriales bacterium]|nr:type II toxin-antitoxin system RelB/DinJ family antitoxin [Eubacteriales bacterium]
MANVTIRMDDELKKQAEEVFSKMGLNMTTAMTLYVKQVVLQNRIPFEITADPFYGGSNQRRLRLAVRDAENGKLAPHEPIEVENE